MQTKLEIQEVLEAAKKDWKDKYEKYYYHTPSTITAAIDAKFLVEQKEKEVPTFDPIKIGYVQGIIDILQWVLDVSPTEKSLKDIHIREKYRLKSETFKFDD